MSIVDISAGTKKSGVQYNIVTGLNGKSVLLRDVDEVTTFSMGPFDDALPPGGPDL